MDVISQYKYDITERDSRKLRRKYWLVKPILKEKLPRAEFEALKAALFRAGADSYISRLEGFGFYQKEKPIIEELSKLSKEESEQEQQSEKQSSAQVQLNNPKKTKTAQQNHKNNSAKKEEQLFNAAKSKNTSIPKVQLWRTIVDKKKHNYGEYTADDLKKAYAYEGLGGLASRDKTFIKALNPEERTGILDQFYTPDSVIAKMWGLAYKHGFEPQGAAVLEPSCGTGRFLQYIPESVKIVDAFEPDKYPFVAAKLLYPKVNVQQTKFESTFFRDGDVRFYEDISRVKQRYDLVIGNPPYREFKSEYAPQEKEATGKPITYDQYFISRGVDLLKSNGLLVFILPSTFMLNDTQYNAFKRHLESKAKLIDAYRLPSKLFSNTQVQTDILVFRKL